MKRYTKGESQSVADIITGKFLDKIANEKVLPWQKPWKTLGCINLISGKAYRGINVIITSLFGKGHAFLTFNQAQDNGGFVTKGSKGLPIVFYKPLEKKDKSGKVEVGADGKPVRIPLLRYYTVFNLCDIQAIPGREKELETLKAKAEKLVKVIDFVPHEMAEKLIASINPIIPISYGGNAACYTPAMHAIRLPLREAFHSVEEYYCTCFHEIGHSLAKETGKPLEGSFGDASYSKEELVAELFANFCLSFCGIDSSKAFNNSTAYLNHWMSKLGEEPKLIIQASAQAQKRFDWLLEKTFGKPQETEEGEKEIANNGNGGN